MSKMKRSSRLESARALREASLLSVGEEQRLERQARECNTEIELVNDKVRGDRLYRTMHRTMHRKSILHAAIAHSITCSVHPYPDLETRIQNSTNRRGLPQGD